MSMEPARVGGTCARSRAEPGASLSATADELECHPIMTVTTNDPSIAETRRDELAGRLVGAALGALDLQAVYLGDRLGLYRAARRTAARPPRRSSPRGPASIHATPGNGWSTRPSARSSTSTTSTAAPDDRRYSLPDGHAAVLIDPDSPWLVASVSPGSSSAVRQHDARLLEAYRTGGRRRLGRLWPGRRGGPGGPQSAAVPHFVGDWIDALPDIAARLRDGQGRVADVACGTGWSSISIARHFPGDRRSTASTSTRARSSGPRRTPQPRASTDRVSFLFADAATPTAPAATTS